MSTLSKSKKVLITIAAVVAGLIIGIFSGLALGFAKNEYTSASDVFTLMKVDFGAEYSILSTEELESYKFTDETYSNVSQALMVKRHEDFAEYLKSRGCTEYKPRVMSRCYFSTSDGKKFLLIRKVASDGILGLFPYSIEVLEGVTMDDIA